jgi:glutamate 5-kinase
MASKIAAARIASWSGIRVVIAKADRPSVLCDAVAHQSGVGTVVAAQPRRLPARKLWIAFALPPAGRVTVDDGARRALIERDASLLPAGVRSIRGTWQVADAIEIAGLDGTVIAKGIARLPSARADEWLAKRTAELAGDLNHELVHRDDLVVLIGAVGADT